MSYILSDLLSPLHIQKYIFVKRHDKYVLYQISWYGNKMGI